MTKWLLINRNRFPSFFTDIDQQIQVTDHNPSDRQARFPPPSHALVLGCHANPKGAKKLLVDCGRGEEVNVCCKRHLRGVASLATRLGPTRPTPSLNTFQPPFLEPHLPLISLRALLSAKQIELVGMSARCEAPRFQLGGATQGGANESQALCN